MIFSIPKLRPLLLTAAGVAMFFAGAGCNEKPFIVKTPASVADQPQADEATEFRAASRSVALVHSGATEGGPTYWYYNPNSDYTNVQNYVIDPLMFLAQVGSLPATVPMDNPFRKVVWSGDVLPPSYTVAPPYAPEVPYGPPNPDPDPLVAPRGPLAPMIPPIRDPRGPIIMPPPPPAPRAPVMSSVPPKTTTNPTTRPAK